MTATTLLSLTAVLFCAPLSAATYHVSDKSGDDSKDGLADASAWKTLAHACEKVAAGDTVIVHPGVYYEHVRLEKGGAVDKPIRFAADAVEKNRVVVTGARRDIRQGEVIWKAEDAKLNIFSLKVDAKPARVLVEEADFFFYPTLGELKKLTLANGVPGPVRGCSYDEKEERLFVRLGSKDGDANPGRHVTKVAPAGSAPGGVMRSADANFSVMAAEAANVVIEGFTFETPGLCGVFTVGGGVTVRDCWFLGCRTGVAGCAVGDGKPSTDVTVERCEFTQAPAFADVEEIVARANEPMPGGEERPKLPPYFWNIRSGGANAYDYGLVMNAGARWKILHNYVHDAVDGLSGASLGNARDCEVAYNTFERLLDDAVETGDHGAGLHVHDNFVTDVPQAFSWDPKNGTPWPGPVTLDHNVVTATLRGAKLWLAMGETPAFLELNCRDGNWEGVGMKNVAKSPVKIPGAGLAAFNNTIILTTGDIFSFGGLRYRKIEGVRFLNNIVVTRRFTPERYHDAADLSGMEFDGNLVAPGSTHSSGPGTRFAGPHGKALDDAARIEIADPARRDFSLKAKSPAIGAGIDCRDLAGISTDVGAFARGADGKQKPAGPRLSPEKKTTVPPAVAAPWKPQ